MLIVADTSVIINGGLYSKVKSGSLHDLEIIIPQAVLDELQSQASQKKEQGLAGLNGVKKLYGLAGQFNVTVSLKGGHPTPDDISLASGGRIDAMINDVARQNRATLYTSDRIQYLAAQAGGIEAVFVEPPSQDPEFLGYFGPDTMSVHLKEGNPPMAKRGRPGSSKLVELDAKPLSARHLQSLSSQILDAVMASDSGTVEISRPGAQVVQYNDYRIAVTKPPFSEGIEITIVHPIVKMSIDQYAISDELMGRFTDGAEGILISGAPGSGKSTLASGLADFYHGMGKIVKTFESPRDLQVDSGITQYTKLDGSFENTADILLLVRPDYTVFDEVRRREDFETFSDMRLAGVGMIGVVHANTPLDAVQRFIGKIELGMIPNVLDTIVFVKDGQIAKVYSLKLKVKVPTGMTESDLARPVIEVRDFGDNTLEHEIYTFGEENIIMPVPKHAKKVGVERLAGDRIREAFRMYDRGADVDIISEGRARVTVDRQCVPAIIGKGGSNIEGIERSLGISIDVVGREPESGPESADLSFTFSESRAALLLLVEREYASMQADMYVGDMHVASARIGRKGQIKIPKRSDAARMLMQAESRGDIRVRLRDA